MPITSPPAEGPPYFRLVFTAYWTDTSPSTEVFYARRHGIFFTYKGISALEDYAFQLLQAHATDSELDGVIYTGGVPIELDPDDVTAIGWRLVEGSN